MRLSSILSNTEEPFGIVEQFVYNDQYTFVENEVSDEVRLLVSGDFIPIDIGRINLPFYSNRCNDTVMFASRRKLHCLFINEKLISIDCDMQCSDYDSNDQKCKLCNPSVQSWFLIEIDDIFSNFTNAIIIKKNHKLSNDIKLPIEVEDKYREWFAKADIAFKERLGAGAIVYLRSIFEKITFDVGTEINDKIRNKHGNTINLNKLTFKDLLTKVDEVYSIIPESYAKNGHELFGQLSEIAHGNSDEQTALEKYEHLRRLVKSVVDNVNSKRQDIINNIEITDALTKLGISTGGETDE